ncbi:hypothetical protein ACA910_016934 [Epithemia clementina (nom. ined.)]
MVTRTTATTHLTISRPDIAAGTCCFEEATAECEDDIIGRLFQRRQRSHEVEGTTPALPADKGMDTLPSLGETLLISVPALDINPSYQESDSSNKYTAFLCRVAPGKSSPPITGGATFRFDTSIQVVRETSKDYGSSKILGYFDGIHHYVGQNGQAVSGNKVYSSRFHPQASSADIGNSGILEKTRGFVEAVGVPTLLLSLRLKHYRGDGKAAHHCPPPNQDDNPLVMPRFPSQKTNNQHDLLLQSCLKRSLVGCVLLWEENQCNTVVRLACLDQVHRFSIESLTPKHSGANKDTCNLFSISPSTIITFVLHDLLHLQKQACIDETIIGQSQILNQPLPLSPTARLLDETLRIVLQQQNFKNPQQQSRRQTFGLQPPRSFLLTGPPGVGKTHAVRSAVDSVNMRYGVSAPCCHLVSFAGSDLTAKQGHLGETAQNLDQIFHSAASFFRRTNGGQQRIGVVLLFLDEAEALVASTILGTKLALLLDQMNNDHGWAQLVVAAATNRIDDIPDYLRRPGRFDQEIAIAPPTVEERTEILESLLLSCSGQFGLVAQEIEKEEVLKLSELCVGYVPADLGALVRQAMMLLSTSYTEDALQDGSTPASSTLVECLYLAKDEVGASALRDAALKAPPTTTWDDIAGDPGGAKTALRQSIEWPRTKRDAFRAVGLVPPRGILLAGPPGCAKTSLARAAAGASGVAFLSLAPADVYASSYVGEAESIVRRAFTLARSAAPCILFFDEIDAIIGTDHATSNGSNSNFRMGRGSSAEARVLSTFLNEMDGIDIESSSVDGVLVLAATNRPSTLDAALLRPGRFDKVIHVPPPDEPGRHSILELQTRFWPVDGNGLNLEKLASDEWTLNMTGAEIVGACREAAQSALREALALQENEAAEVIITQRHLEDALARVQPLLANPRNFEEYNTMFP